MQGTSCLSVPACPSGTTLNASTDRCEVSIYSYTTYTCPDGFVQGEATTYYYPVWGWLTTYVCYQFPYCPQGSVYSSANNRCEAPSTLHYYCPQELTLSSNYCYGTPYCPPGSQYIASQDRCEDAKCPGNPSYPCVTDPTDNIKKCSTHPCVTLANAMATEEVNSSTGGLEYKNDGTVDENGECQGVVLIFNGKPGVCRKAGLKTSGLSCCNDDIDKFLFIQENCNEEEKALVQKRAAGLCHEVGEFCQSKIFGACVQKATTYCCFNSKLGRIIHEQGRPQLKSFAGNMWGTPESANCRGFTPEEFQSLDFSKINLGEYIQGVSQTMSEKITKNVSKSINDFQTKMSTIGR